MKINKSIGFLAIIVCFLAASTSHECLAKKKDPAKYVFLFIGDGMGFSHVAATESYISYKAGKLGGEQLTFTQFPVHGSATNHSANRRVTDSAASGTAIACGVKTNNGSVGVDEEGVSVRSISEILQDRGYDIGIISSVPVNHATPASFYAHNVNRGAYYDIMMEIPKSGFDFFAGAGMLGYFGRNKDQESSAAWLEKNGINVCFNREEAKEAISNGDRILVCQPYNEEREPSNYDAGGIMPEGHILLSETMEMALERLTDDSPFFIMCEGGEIDWAAHANKTMPTIQDILAFDDAISVAYDFYLEHPKETLIIVTADHATGGISFSEDPDWEKIEKAWVDAGYSNTLDSKENRKLNNESKVGWTTGGHTGEAVPVYAIGKGAERFGGRIDNTDIKGKILGE